MLNQKKVNLVILLLTGWYLIFTKGKFLNILKIRSVNDLKNFALKQPTDLLILGILFFIIFKLYNKNNIENFNPSVPQVFNIPCYISTSNYVNNINCWKNPEQDKCTISAMKSNNRNNDSLNPCQKADITLYNHLLKYQSDNATSKTNLFINELNTSPQNQAMNSNINLTGFFTIIGLFLTLVLGSGSYIGYELIFDRFKISDIRLGDENIFKGMMVTFILAMKLFSLYLIYYAYHPSTNFISNESVISKAVNVGMLSIYLLTLLIPGKKAKIMTYSLVLMLHMLLFSVPYISDNRIISQIFVYVAVFAIVILGIKHALSPGDRYNFVYTIIGVSLVLLALHGGPDSLFKTVISEEEIRKIKDIGNKSWKSLLIAVVVGILIFKYVMNPYSSEKVLYRPNKENFFIKELRRN